MSANGSPDHLGLELSYMAAMNEVREAERAEDVEAQHIAQLKADEAVRLIGELLGIVD